jgi:hypothetical protein
MNREALEAPFPPELVRQRAGRNGMTLDYIEIQDVIARLNAAVEGEWSFEVTRKETNDDEIVVFRRLKIGDVVHEDVGGTNITRSRDGGSPVSIVDDTKAAVSDCLKRCARQAGVGLHLGRAADHELPRAPAVQAAPVATGAQIGKLRALAGTEADRPHRVGGGSFLLRARGAPKRRCERAHRRDAR